MMTTSQTCPQCGAELPPGRLAGLCPKCLLQQALPSESPALARTEASDRGGSLPAFLAPEAAELARHFPQLEILDLLGVGGMGAVYKARQPSLDRLVALKILPVEVGRDPAFAERFTREAKALARLNHPHIVTIHDIGQADGLYYIIMEYVDGANLRQMTAAQTLTPQQALALVPQLCEALQYAHDEGIVHRDIKPENILVDKRGRAKIADFGLAKIVGQQLLNTSLTATQQVMGTLRYMAPEQMLGARDVDHRADIYALGVVFYELLTGELPMGRFPLPSERVRCDARLDEVVLKALERERERRYQQASDIKTDVELISGSYRLVPDERPAKPAGPAPLVDFEQAADEIRPAARALLGVALLQLVVGLGMALFSAIIWEMSGPRTMPTDTWPGFILAGLWHVPVALFLVPAGWQMLRLRSYEFAIIGSVIAMLPLGVTWTLTGPLGLWALLVLLRPNVRAAFRVPLRQRQGEPAQDIRQALSNEEFEQAAEELRAPAWSLIGIVFLEYLLLAIGVVLSTLVFPNKAGDNEPLMFLGFAALTALPTGIIVLFAANGMRRVRSFEMAVIGSIIAMLPLRPTCLLMGPVGLWSLLVLLRPQVRAAFRTPLNKRPEAWADHDLELLAARERDPAGFTRAYERVSARCRAAGVAQMVMAGCDLAAAMLILAILLTTSHDVPVSRVIPFVALPTLVVAITCCGAISLLRLRGWGFAMIGAVLTILPLTPLWFIRWIVGVWALRTLLRRDVLAAFRRTAEGATPSSANKPAPTTPAIYAAERPAPATALALPTPMLVAGLVLGGMMVTAGVALVPLAWLQGREHAGTSWGLIGAAFGCLCGGLGTVAGCWNDYRQKHGQRNLLAEPEWTWFDEGLCLYLAAGLISLAAAPLALGTWQQSTRYALALVGILLTAQGALLLAIRTSMRSAARRQMGFEEGARGDESWGNWWRDRSGFFRHAVSALCMVGFLVALVLFFSFSSSGLPERAAGMAQEPLRIHVGQPTPWLVVAREAPQQPGVQHLRTEIRGSWSWLYGGLALVLLEAVAATRRWDSPAARSSIAARAVLTGIIAAIAVAVAVCVGLTLVM